MPLIMIKINDMNIIALIDTISYESSISLDMATKCGIRHKTDKK